jgi:hypothetical protein
LVLLAVADFADDEGVAWPSVRTLARRSRIGERAVWAILRRPIESGELVIVKHGGGRIVGTGRIPGTDAKGRSNRYKLAINPDRTITVSGNTDPANTDGDDRNPDPECTNPDPRIRRSVNEIRHIDPSYARAFKKRPTKSGKPETPLPDSFVLTAELRKYAIDHGRGDPDLEFDGFRQHALAHDRRCRDWSAAFRQWCTSGYGSSSSKNKDAGSTSINAKDLWK